MSLPGLTGQSSTPSRCLLDRPVKPGDDNEVCVKLNKQRSGLILKHFAAALLLAVAFADIPPTVVAQPAPPSPPPAAAAPARQRVVIGFVDIEGDPRYEPVRAYERLVLKTRDHPFPGAQGGIDEAQALVRVLNTEFALERITVKAPDQVAGAVTRAMTERGIKFFLIDAPAEAFKPLAAAVKGR